MKDKLIRSRYWNANGFAVAIVAVVTLRPTTNNHTEPLPIDWACYIGATEGGFTLEADTVIFAYRNGCKLSRDEALAFFPQFAKVPYRA